MVRKIMVSFIPESSLPFAQVIEFYRKTAAKASPSPFPPETPDTQANVLVSPEYFFRNDTKSSAPCIFQTDLSGNFLVFKLTNSQHIP